MLPKSWKVKIITLMVAHQLFDQETEVMNNWLLSRKKREYNGIQENQAHQNRTKLKKLGKRLAPVK